MKEERVIIALDLPSAEEALHVVDELGDMVGTFKVGLELIHRAGWGIIEEIKKRGFRVFYDGKFLDIPNTVQGAVRACTALGVWMLNVHALGGREMLEAAVKAGREEAEHLGIEKPLVVAVTLLTSIGKPQLEEMGISLSPQGLVRNLAVLARESGCDGVVCSPQEIEAIREECGEDFLIVCPGVRWGERDDHKRSADPRWAIEKGANYIVIGRPILKASSPRSALLELIRSLPKRKG